MKKVVLVVGLAAVFLTACSKDDGPAKKCESCTSNAGNTHKICDNGNETYDYTIGSTTTTITKEELAGLSIKQVVEATCELDL
ncbi:hypothetical protein J0X14_01925 [Muricauda sp. CAU 1633]|uniref:hypothetical protein n=1 Tax=Allomuricauda sp. CAU 1633 TaxID=2816036 RepID=UPI001A8D1879|nr:hypothetical protein [Muricauda sp. CAU 1633]MBO0321038.1 hypothetical protein [Muricauda sp. CAU 1633]